MRQPVFLALIVLGLLIHLAALFVPGAEGASLSGWPLFDPELLHRLQSLTASRPGGASFPTLLKIPGLLMNALLAAVAYRVTLQRTNDPPAARWALLACWLNPALIVNGDILGFPDLWAGVPVVLALLLAHTGAYFAAGVFCAAAALTLPHTVLLVPPVLAASLALRGDAGAFRVLFGIAAGAIALLAPVLAHEGVAPVRTAAAVWLPRESDDLVHVPGAWIAATWLAARVPWPKAIRVPQFRGRQWITSRAIGCALAATVVLRGGWQALQTRTLAVHAAWGALIVQAIVTLVPGAPVHSQSLAIAPLALAAALRPGLRAVFYALTFVLATALAVSHAAAWPYGRLVTRAEPLTNLALGLANLVVLIWLASQLTAEAYARPRTYVV